jgi:hypothetical protein
MSRALIGVTSQVMITAVVSCCQSYFKVATHFAYLTGQLEKLWFLVSFISPQYLPLFAHYQIPNDANVDLI